MATKIQLRRDVASSWANSNPILAQGEPGLEIDTHKIKYGDGVTLWNDLPYSGGGTESTQNQFIMLFEGEFPVATSISFDGKNWTPGIATTLYSFLNVYSYDLAAGNGSIAYLSYNYNIEGSDILWSNNANQPISPSLTTVVNSGPNGEQLAWQKIHFLNGYFVAVGYYRPSINNPNNWNFPCFVYSQDAKNWTWGDVDLTYISTLITNEINAGNSVSGISMEDVSSNGTGWLFGQHYMWNYVNDAIPAGAYYVTHLNSTLGSANYISTLPGLYKVYFDGHGWVAYGGGNNNNVFFNTNTNPTVGSWTTVDLNTATATVWPDGNGFGTDSGFLSGSGRISAGKSNGENIMLLSMSNGRVLVTSDQGVTFTGSVPSPYQYNITSVTASNPAQIVPSDWNIIYNGMPVTITGANTPQLNGSFYLKTSSGSPFSLYTDAAMTVGLDSTSWGGNYTDSSATITFSTGDIINYLTYGNDGVFTGVDNSNPKIWTTTNGIDWTWTLAQLGWIGPWDYSAMTYGTVSIDSGYLVSSSNVIPGVTNVLSLSNDFNVMTVNGYPVIENNGPIGVGSISLSPTNLGWNIGSYLFQFGGGTSINSSFWNETISNPFNLNSDVEVQTPNSSWGFVNNASDMFTFYHNYYTGPALIIPQNSDIIDNTGNSIKDIPQNIQNGDYTIQYTDRGKHIYGNNTSSVSTIHVPVFSTTKFNVGSTIVIVTNQSQGINIAASNSGVTTLIGSGIGPNPNGFLLPENSMATLLNIGQDTWMISGTGLVGN